MAILNLVRTDDGEFLLQGSGDPSAHAAFSLFYLDGEGSGNPHDFGCIEWEVVSPGEEYDPDDSDTFWEARARVLAAAPDKVRRIAAQNEEGWGLIVHPHREANMSMIAFARSALALSDAEAEAAYRTIRDELHQDYQRAEIEPAVGEHCAEQCQWVLAIRTGRFDSCLDSMQAVLALLRKPEVPS